MDNKFFVDGYLLIRKVRSTFPIIYHISLQLLTTIHFSSDPSKTNMVEQSIANQQNQTQIKKDSEIKHSSTQQSSSDEQQQEDLSYIYRICDELRDTFYKQKVPTKSYEWRMEQLGQLKKMLEDHKKDFGDALAADLGSSPIMKTIEVENPLEEITGVMKQLKTWMQPEEKSIDLIVHKPGLIINTIIVVTITSSFHQ